MRSKLLIIFLALSGVGDLRLIADLQKPVVERQTESRPAMSNLQTLEELWAAAHIIVEGHIESSTAVKFASAANPEPAPQTAFRVTLVEVFKSDGRLEAATEAITVRQSGGDTDRGTYIERVLPPSGQRYSVGSRYILFLRRHDLPNESFYSSASFGAEGDFKIVGTQLDTPGKRLGLQLARQGADALRQGLRSRKGSQ